MRSILYDLIDKQKIINIPYELDDLVYVIDPESYEVLYINKHAQALWGNIIGKKCWESICGETKVCSVCNIKELLWNSDSTGFNKQELYNRLLDRWLDSRSCIVDWYDGRKVRLGIAIDITERKRYEEKLLLANLEKEAAVQEIIAIEEELRCQYQKLEEQGEELKNSKQQLESIIDFLPDATFVIDNEGIIIAWNKAMETMTGVMAEDMLGKGNYEYSLPFYETRRPMLLDLVQKYDQEIADKYESLTYDESTHTFRVEKFFLGNKEKFLSVKAAPLLDSKGEVTGAIESIRDITDLKETETQLRYLAEYDNVTGVYNRASFEREINSEDDKNISKGLIVIDIDGLKLINDTIGYRAGDNSLITIAQILRKVSPEKSLIARIGGDEFCVIVRQTIESELQTILRSINKAVEEYNHTAPLIPFSISTGYAYSDEKKTMLQLFKEAEERMNYEKLLHNQSTRSRMVDVLMKALEARDLITEGHTERLGDLVESVAQKLGMPEYKINNLKLFASFHDIGKVGIPDAILFKPGKLSKEEFEEMKKHSEIGYRIAHSTPDLSHISDWILKHHEWWNGKGYPFGMAGENIPLECRILAIADAYDSMSNDRPYRKAMEHEDIVQELKRFSGVQFDPEIIDVFLDILADSHPQKAIAEINRCADNTLVQN